MDHAKAKDVAESEGTRDIRKARTTLHWMIGGVVVVVALLLGLIWFMIWKNNSSTHDVYASNDQAQQYHASPAPEQAKLRGSITLDVASYHVTDDAIFDRSGPGNRATCMWPEYYSSDYQEVVIHKSGGDYTFKGGVQQGGDPGGSVRSIYVKAWPGHPVDPTTQLKHWGSDCGAGPTDADTEARLQEKADAGTN